MIVTSIEPLTKTRFKVYIDGQFSFVLYKGELSRYHICEEQKLKEETYHKIITEVVTKRAKLRALHLLENMDRTESQLRTKLKQGQYTDDIVDQAIDYVKSFGYMNDLEYARRYISSKNKTKSKWEIHAGLCQKGVNHQLVDQAIEEFFEEHNDMEAIRSILKKKRFDPEKADDKEKQRISSYLNRKGFRYDDIRQVIQVYD